MTDDYDDGIRIGRRYTVHTDEGTLDVRVIARHADTVECDVRASGIAGPMRLHVSTEHLIRLLDTRVA